MNRSAPETSITLPACAAGGEAAATSERAGAHRQWSRWWLLGLWGIPSLVSSSQIYFFFQHKGGPPMSFWTALLWQGPPWVFWALMTPIIIWLGRRFPLERRAWGVSIPVHLAANLVMAPFHMMCAVLTARLAGLEWYVNNPFGEVVIALLGKNFHLDLFVYWGVLAMVHAFEYHRRFREGELFAAQIEAKLAQAELQALKMQLHPHFLFNTLHAIGVLVRKQDTQASVRMLAGLSDLLRLALDSAGRPIVPLKQELDFVDRYLDIEKTRFRDRLTVHTDVAPEALDAEIPNLILQPVVENAIRHGIAPRAAPGRVEIDARRRGEALVVEVRDDGRGLDAGWDAERREGMGLGNVRARLSQLYPGAHRLSVEPRPAGGVLVTIEVPFRLALAEVAHG